MIVPRAFTRQQYDPLTAELLVRQVPTIKTAKASGAIVIDTIGLVASLSVMPNALVHLNAPADTEINRSNRAWRIGSLDGLGRGDLPGAGLPTPIAADVSVATSCLLALHSLPAGKYFPD